MILLNIHQAHSTKLTKTSLRLEILNQKQKVKLNTEQQQTTTAWLRRFDRISREFKLRSQLKILNFGKNSNQN